MTRSRRTLGQLTMACVLGVVCFLVPVSGQGGDTAGMITELKIGHGRVEVRPTGTQEWRRGQPLLALRVGDTVRATKDASVVILLSGGRGTVGVNRANSPFVIPAPQSGETKARKVMMLLEASLRFLSATSREEPRAILSTRGGFRPRPPVILSPRNGPVLPGSLTFEWLGSRLSRYTIRILGPEGMVLEKMDLTGTRFDYPADAPSLTPGARYTFQVRSGSHPSRQAWFEVLDSTRTKAIQRDMQELERAIDATTSSNTLVALRVAFLANNGLLHDARRLLVTALKEDAGEPTLHLLLGRLYSEVGLRDQAAKSYENARLLMSSPIKR